jgi:hypothetical protein
VVHRRQIETQFRDLLFLIFSGLGCRRIDIRSHVPRRRTEENLHPVARMRRLASSAIGLCLILTGCGRPLALTTDPPLNVGGTIAGIVRATEGTVALSARKVTATHVPTGEQFETTTGVNGGYTLKVPHQGRYELQVELRDGEVLTKGATSTDINNGDLDPGRDFEITIKPSR